MSFHGEDILNTLPYKISRLGISLVPENREIFTREIEVFRHFTRELTGRSWDELDTFIPLALVADYDKVDWRRLQL